MVMTVREKYFQGSSTEAPEDMAWSPVITGTGTVEQFLWLFDRAVYTHPKPQL